jgi:hypothetical protein
VSRDRVYGHTRSGEPITNKDIETLAAEAEAGYDVARCSLAGASADAQR